MKKNKLYDKYIAYKFNEGPKPENFVINNDAIKYFRKKADAYSIKGGASMKFAKVLDKVSNGLLNTSDFLYDTCDKFIKMGAVFIGADIITSNLTNIGFTNLEQLARLTDTCGDVGFGLGVASVVGGAALGLVSGLVSIGETKLAESSFVDLTKAQVLVDTIIENTNSKDKDLEQ